MFSRQEIEDLESRLSAVNPQSLVAIAESMRKKCYSNHPNAKIELRVSGLPNIDDGFESLKKYAYELNGYLGRALVGVRRCETYFNDDTFEHETSVKLNVRNAIILQDREARERRGSLLSKAKNFITGGEYGRRQSDWIFSRLGTPELLADLQRYDWSIVNMNMIHSILSWRRK